MQQVDTTNVQIGILASENKLLKGELIKQKHKIDEIQTSPDNLSQLIIGVSLLRDFYSNDQTKLMIPSLSGAKLCFIEKQTEDLWPKQKNVSAMSILLLDRTAVQFQIPVQTLYLKMPLRFLKLPLK